MPRIMLDVSDSWYARYKTGVMQVIDTLDGLSAQLDEPPIEDVQQALAKMAEIANQLRDLSRNVQSWRIPF